MLPLQYDQPYIWCPNIYSRPFELYALYKCRAGHQVFSKVMLSQGAAQLNWHYMASAEHIISRIRLLAKLSAEHTVGRTQQLAEYNSWQNTQLAEHTIGRIQQSAKLSAEHTVGRTQLSAEYNCRQNTTVSRIHSRQNTLLAEHNSWQNTTVGRIHCWQNTLLAEYTVGRTQQWHNMLLAIYHQHNALWHYVMTMSNSRSYLVTPVALQLCSSTPVAHHLLWSRSCR